MFGSLSDHSLLVIDGDTYKELVTIRSIPLPVNLYSVKVQALYDYLNTFLAVANLKIVSVEDMVLTDDRSLAISSIVSIGDEDAEPSDGVSESTDEDSETSVDSAKD